MKKTCFLITCLLLANLLHAQKKPKFFEVNTCDLLGIPLPASTKKDTRMLPVVSAGGVLKPEAGPGFELGETEVYELPVSSSYNKDSLIGSLSAGGWTVDPALKKDKNLDGDFVWLTRNGKRAFAYFTSDKYQKSLYVAEAKENVAANKTGNIPSQAPGTPPATKQAPPPTPAGQPMNTAPQQNSAAAAPGKYTFTTTNYDDGWSATEKENWVECSNGNRKYLIHYPNEKTRFVSGTPDQFAREAWNALVAPRWNSMTDFFLMSNNMSYPGACFASANMSDASGHTYYVVLFNKGRSPWMEFIYPDKATFIKEFGVDRPDFYFTGWEPLEKMQWTRRFAVAPQDIVGKWSSDFGGMLQYVNTFTGADAGMNTHSSNTVYEFFPDGTYTWSLKMATGYVGSINYLGTNSKGTYKIIENWKIWLSDIEGKPREYKVLFEPFKGGRILWIDGKEFGRSDK